MWWLYIYFILHYISVAFLLILFFVYLTMFFLRFQRKFFLITFTLPPYTSKFAPLFLLVQHCVLFSPLMLIVVHIYTWMWSLQQKHGALIRSYTYTLREKWSSFSNYQTIANSLDQGWNYIPHSSSCWILSASGLHRSGARFHNCFEFICITAMLCLDDTFP